MIVPDDFRTWLEELVAAEATIPARVVLARLPAEDTPEPVAAKSSQSDRMLTVQEAAERLGVDTRWVYRRAKKLPFTRKLSTGTLRFSERGLERWKESRR